MFLLLTSRTKTYLSGGNRWSAKRFLNSCHKLHTGKLVDIKKGRIGKKGAVLKKGNTLSRIFIPTNAFQSYPSLSEWSCLFCSFTLYLSISFAFQG